MRGGMSAKDDYSNYDEKYSEAKRVSSKGTDDDDDVDCYDDDKASGGGGSNYNTQNNCIHVNVLSINIAPSDEVDLSAGLDLRISFELDRDVIAGYWVVQFLVDTSSRRVIKVLGQTDVEDYPEGESDMSFYTSQVDISGISPSTLSNSGRHAYHVPLSF